MSKIATLCSSVGEIKLTFNLNIASGITVKIVDENKAIVFHTIKGSTNTTVTVPCEKGQVFYCVVDGLGWTGDVSFNEAGVTQEDGSHIKVVVNGYNPSVTMKLTVRTDLPPHTMFDPLPYKYRFSPGVTVTPGFVVKNTGTYNLAVGVENGFSLSYTISLKGNTIYTDTFRVDYSKRSSTEYAITGVYMNGNSLLDQFGSGVTFTVKEVPKPYIEISEASTQAATLSEDPHKTLTLISGLKLHE